METAAFVFSLLAFLAATAGLTLQLAQAGFVGYLFFRARSTGPGVSPGPVAVIVNTGDNVDVTVDEDPTPGGDDDGEDDNDDPWESDPNSWKKKPRFNPDEEN